MITFGVSDIEWRDASGVSHVIVATKGASWQHLCHALPADYVTWDFGAAPPVNERSTGDLVVWRHDRKKVDCHGCLAVLDGAVVIRVPIISTEDTRFVFTTGSR